MTLLDRLSRWSGALATLLVPLLLLIPGLYIAPLTADTFKVSPEIIILLGGGLVVLTISLGRALGGHPALGGGAGSPVRWLLAGLTLWVALTSVFAFNTRMAWVFSATFITYMLVGQSVLDWLEDGRSRRKVLLGTLGALALFQTVIGAIQLLRLPVRAWAAETPVWPVPGGSWPQDFLVAVASGADRGIAIGTFGNPNYLAECLVLLWPVLFAATVVIKSRWVKTAAFAVLFLIAGVLLGTSARAATAGLVLSGIAAVWLIWGTESVARLRQGWASSRGRLTIGAMASAMIVLLAVTGGPMAAKLQHLSTDDESISSRLLNWRVAVTMIAERPIQGAGLGNYKALNSDKLVEMHPEGLPAFGTKTRFVQAHNEPLQAIVELGLVGGLLIFGALVLWVRETRTNESLSKPLRFGLIWGVGAVFLSGLFGFPFHIPVTALSLMAVLALGLAGAKSASPPILSAPSRLAYSAVVAAILGVLFWQVAVKDALPLYAGARYQDLGEKLAKLDSGDTTLTVLSLAERTQRYRAVAVEKKLRALVEAKKYNEAIELYDRSDREGLGIASIYWKGRALQKLDRNQEAYDIYSRLAKLYPDDSPYNKRVTRYMRVLKQKLGNGQTKAQPLKEGR